MSRRSLSLAALAALAALPAPAGAGRRPHAYLRSGETLTERTVELAQTVDERHVPLDGARFSGGAGSCTACHSATALGFEAAVGVTDWLELAAPVDWVWYEFAEGAADPPDVTELEGYGLEARVRLAPVDPAEAGAVVPLLRLGARRLVAHDVAVLDGDLSLTASLGERVTAAVGVGASAWHDGTVARTRSAAGISVDVGAGVGVGAELLGQGALAMEHEGEDVGFVAAGPDLSWSAGPFWLVLAVLFPVTPEAPPATARLVWALDL